LSTLGSRSEASRARSASHSSTTVFTSLSLCGNSGSISSIITGNSGTVPAKPTAMVPTITSRRRSPRLVMAPVSRVTVRTRGSPPTERFAQRLIERYGDRHDL
jgi:hypothetical protein